MIYTLLLLTVALGGISIAAALYSRAGQKKLAEQMKLVIQSQHATLGQTQTSDKKLDWLRYEQQQSKEMQEHHFEQHSRALDHQRKSLEHQRVLLASLNRQLQDIDQIYDGPAPTGNAAPARNGVGQATPQAAATQTRQAQTSLKPHPAMIRKIAQEGKPVSLSQLFSSGLAAQRQANGSGNDRQSSQTDGAATVVKNRVAEEPALRRVANG